jgi:hypothetical protein
MKLKLGHSFQGRHLGLPRGVWTARVFEGDMVLLTREFQHRNFPDLQLCVWRKKKDLQKMIY